MRKIVFILLILLSSSAIAKAQCIQSYKPLNVYAKDTTAYLIYNFVDRLPCYKQKALRLLTNDLEPKIDHITMISYSDAKGGFAGLEVSFSTSSITPALFIEFEESNPRKGGELDPSLPKIEAAIKQFDGAKVKSINLMLDKKSSYYPKYKAYVKSTMSKRRSVGIVIDNRKFTPVPYFQK